MHVNPDGSLCLQPADLIRDYADPADPQSYAHDARIAAAYAAAAGHAITFALPDGTRLTFDRRATRRFRQLEGREV